MINMRLFVLRKKDAAKLVSAFFFVDYYISSSTFDYFAIGFFEPISSGLTHKTVTVHEDAIMGSLGMSSFHL
jgi:hypothetical protein